MSMAVAIVTDYVWVDNPYYVYHILLANQQNALSYLGRANRAR